MAKTVAGKDRKFLIFDEAGYLAVENDTLDDELIVGKDKLIEVMEEIAEDKDIEDFTIFEVTKIGFTAEKQMTVTLDK